MPFITEPIACSRMPKCSTRPYQSPENILLACSGGRKLGSPFGVVLLEPARSAEPPQSSGSTGAIAVRMSPDATRVATPFSSASQLGSASVQPSGRVRVRIRSKSALRSPALAAQVSKSLLPGGLLGLAALDGLPGVLDDLVGDVEGPVGVEAEHLLGRGDLVGAERGAVRLAGVLQGRGGPGDDRAQVDERRPAGLGLGRLERLEEGADVLVVALAVVGPVDVLHVPAVRLVALGDVLAERDRGVVLDRDAVVVVQHDQVAELLVAGE